MMNRVTYRIWQTTQALTAGLRPVDEGIAAEQLSPELFALFKSMARTDQHHHLRVYKQLIADGHDHPAIVQAALLHDVGKTRVRFTIADRIWAVVVKTLWPKIFVRWSQGEPIGWRRAMVASAQHPAWGAEMVAAADGDPFAVELIAHHQDPITDDLSDDLKHWLPIFQAVDDAN